MSTTPSTNLLQRHQYPLIIQIFGLLLLIAIVVSGYKNTFYSLLFKNTSRAQTCICNEQYNEAIQHLNKIAANCNQIPRNVTLLFSEAYALRGRKEDLETAYDYLPNNLNDAEFEKFYPLLSEQFNRYLP